MREAKLEPGKQYIFGFHPHGIMVMSRIFLYGAYCHLRAAAPPPAAGNGLSPPAC